MTTDNQPKPGLDPSSTIKGFGAYNASQCNVLPITIPTGLPSGDQATTFDQSCREAALQMCTAIVRRIELFRAVELERRNENASAALLPPAVAAWTKWAGGLEPIPDKSGRYAGLPSCLSPTWRPTSTAFDEAAAESLGAGAPPPDADAQTSTSTNNKRVRFSFRRVSELSSALAAYDIDDWNGDG